MASRKTTSRPAPDLTAGGTTRVALYLRISTDEDHQPFSLGAPGDPPRRLRHKPTGLGTGQVLHRPVLRRLRRTTRSPTSATRRTPRPLRHPARL